MKPKSKKISMHGNSVEMLPIGAVVPYRENARVHPAEQIRALAATIEKSGFTAPLIIDENGVLISGHGRLLAAQALNMKDVPCVRVRGLSDDQVRALRISDNRLALGSEWNTDVLAAELAALHGKGFDLGDMGFAVLELGHLGVPGFELEARLEKADVVPALNSKPVVKLGELWLLGDHRLLIGDSTNEKDVGRLLSGRAKDLIPLAVLMVTDPPYGVNYDPNWRNEAARASTGMGSRAIGAGAVGKVSNDDRADWTSAWQLFPGNAAYVWHADKFGTTVDLSLQSAGFEVRAQIIWDKGRMIIGRGDYHFEHEPCWYVVRKGKPGGYVGDRKQTTMWRISHQKSDTGHGTQKPVECMRRPILNSSKKGDGVYDPFSGSFTTGIACEMEGRKVFAMEIDPIYAQLSIERWQNFSGKIAHREDGATLKEIQDGARLKSRPRAPSRARTELDTQGLKSRRSKVAGPRGE